MKQRLTKKQKQLRGLVGVLAAVSAVFWVQALRVDSKVVKYTVQSEKISRPVKIALITDLHSCDYGQGQAELMKKIEAETPDFVLLGGDIVDDKLVQDKAIEFLALVSKKYTCFYVSGNHEYRSGQMDEIKAMIEGYGITVLEGENVVFPEANLSICGVDDPQGGAFADQLKNAGDTLDKTTFSILLSHRPEEIERYVEGGFDLALAGHAHGGQWRIPVLLNGLLAPNQGLLPSLAGGLYTAGGMQMIVSRGLARETTRVPRIFNRPEVVIVTILPSVGAGKSMAEIK